MSWWTREPDPERKQTADEIERLTRQFDAALERDPDGPDVGHAMNGLRKAHEAALKKYGDWTASALYRLGQHQARQK